MAMRRKSRGMAARVANAAATQATPGGFFGNLPTEVYEMMIDRMGTDKALGRLATVNRRTRDLTVDVRAQQAFTRYFADAREICKNLVARGIRGLRVGHTVTGVSTGPFEVTVALAPPPLFGAWTGTFKDTWKMHTYGRKLSYFFDVAGARMYVKMHRSFQVLGTRYTMAIEAVEKGGYYINTWVTLSSDGKPVAYAEFSAFITTEDMIKWTAPDAHPILKRVVAGLEPFR